MSEQRGVRDGNSDEPTGEGASGSADTSASDGIAASAGSSKPDLSKAEVSRPDVSRPSGKRPRRTASADSSVTEGKNVATATRVANRTRTEATPKQNPFKRLMRFLREVVAELRKVIWPNRKQMITYTIVVIVFVTFMVAFISGLDLAFIKGVTWLFG